MSSLSGNIRSPCTLKRRLLEDGIRWLRPCIVKWHAPSDIWGNWINQLLFIAMLFVKDIASVSSLASSGRNCDVLDNSVIVAFWTFDPHSYSGERMKYIYILETGIEKENRSDLVRL